jgi:hypothetical protein
MGFSEVLLEEHGAARTVLVHGASDRKRATRGTDVGGGATLDASSATRVLTWAICAEDAAALQLSETPLGIAGGGGGSAGGPAAPTRPTRSHALRVVFPRALLPMACVVDTPPPPSSSATAGGGVSVVVIDVAGTMYRLRLPHPSALRSLGRGAEPILAGITGGDVLVIDDSPALTPLEGPTSLAAVGPRLVAVGGLSGRIAVLDAGTLAPTAELKPAALARLWNSIAMGARGGQHAIRCLRAVPTHSGLLLAALRADCYLQVGLALFTTSFCSQNTS